VQWNRRGVATASLQFIRSLGSAVGVAVMGALMNAKIIAVLGGDPSIPDPLNATNALLDATNRSKLPGDLLHKLQFAFDSALHHAFLVSAIFGVLGLIVTFYFPRAVEKTATE
jgi:hypothetical protein